jgi:hypothetical protein
VIERISAALGSSAAPIIAELLVRIAAYGLPSTLGYDHKTAGESTRFNRRLRLRFARAYDMQDEAIRLLTTDDVRARPFIDAESLRLRVNLPDQVRGDLNPVLGLATCASLILAPNGLVS